jgi:hypothetical protein
MTIQILRRKKEVEFARHKKHTERTLKELLVFCKLGLSLFVVQLTFGTKKNLNNIVTCVILHNMIIEDEKRLKLEFFYDNVGSRVKPHRNRGRIQAFLET